MADSFDAFRYASYMRSRWRFLAAACGTAVGIALAVSLILPREYTATARIVIEPPAGTDPRSIAVSPIYLESLKTYEDFAEDDSLFRKAIDQLELRKLLGQSPIESLKKRVLKVGVVRNTRILEISATLPDAARAQALAHFLAESTVELNRSLATESDRDLAQGIEQQEREARARLREAEAAWTKLLSSEPIDDLQSAQEQGAYLRSDVQEQILKAELEVSDAAAREKQAAEPQAGPSRREASGARARLDELRKQLQGLDRQAADRERLLGARQAHRDRLEAEREASQTVLTAIETRLREARGEAGRRGERLKIIDPGIVPEKPSSPNLPLNAIAALLAGLVLSILYLTFEMSYQQQRASERRNAFHAVSKARDE